VKLIWWGQSDTDRWTPRSIWHRCQNNILHRQWR